MGTYQPLDCDLHDYLEIACMHHYLLHIELIDGTTLDAQAVTTRTTHDKEEFFSVQISDGRRDIRLDQLLAITPLGDTVSFGRIVLADSVCNGAPRSN